MYHRQMAFSIKDEEVQRLADQLQRLKGYKNRTDTLRQALRAQIELATQATPFHQRVVVLQMRASALSPAEVRNGESRDDAS